MKTIYVVTGADSGLGRAIVTALQTFPRMHPMEILPIYGPDSSMHGFDLTSDQEIYDCAEIVEEWTHEVDPEENAYRVLINCAGVNYIDWFQNLQWSEWDRLMNLNAKAGIMLTQQLLSWFNGSGAVLNIISNASHVPMTNSVFYNASKGAFHIATLAMARELRKSHGLCVFGISPNKLRGTRMSSYIEKTVPSMRGWTPEQAAAYQLGALPAQEETDPEQLAEFIAYLLSSPERHKFLTNTVLPYGA